MKESISIVILLLAATSLAGCESQRMPDKAWSDEVHLLPNKYTEIYTLWDGYSQKFELEVEQLPVENGLNVYTMNAENYDNFLNCSEFTFIDDFSWENQTSISGVLESDSDAWGVNDELILVIDNHQCSDELVEAIIFIWTVYVDSDGDGDFEMLCDGHDNSCEQS